MNRTQRRREADWAMRQSMRRHKSLKGIKRRLLRAQRGACALCGEALNLKQGDPRFATLDHKIPLSRGGTDRPDNLQVACWTCNQAKGDTLPVEDVPCP